MDALFTMDQHGIVPSVEMYRSLLKACTKRKALAEAKQVHAHLARHGLESTRFLGESAVKTLVKCGGLRYALEVFGRLPKRSVVSWTAVIAGYVDCGQGPAALALYQSMQEDGVQPNAYTFVSLLGACSSIGDLEKGKRIHSEVLKYNCGSDLFVRTCLVDMYGKCGSITDAQVVFNGLSNRDVVLWNSMLGAYVEQNQPENALQLYEEMMEKDLSPNGRTFVCAAQACSMLADRGEDSKDEWSLKAHSLIKGREIHDHARRKGYDTDVYVGTTLVRMYGKCGSVECAERVFDGLPWRNQVTWTVLLTVYVQHGQAGKALLLYERMRQECVCPDKYTIVSALSACCMLADKKLHATGDWISSKVHCLKVGRAIHTDAIKQSCDSDAYVGNSLISMYGKCGSIVEARHVFDGLSQHDVVSRNLMIAAYVEEGEAEQALQLYHQMQNNAASLDSRTFVSALQACSLVAEAEEDVVVNGRLTKVNCLEHVIAIHAHVQRTGFASDIFVGSSLISAFGKCGCTKSAQNVFDGLTNPDVVAWTAMLTAYVEQHEAEEALQVYHLMLAERVTPNERTFVSALQACASLSEKENDVVISGCPSKVKSLAVGKSIHADAWGQGCCDGFVGNTLVHMYGKCGSIADGNKVFNAMLERDVVSWNAMLGGYVEQGHADRALRLYNQMLEEGVTPNERTYVTALQACCLLAEEEEAVLVVGSSTKIESLKMARVVHADARRQHYDTDVFLGNALLNLYRECGCLNDGCNLFENLLKRDALSYNTLLAAYVERGQLEVALGLYGQMREEGINPTERTFVIALQACVMLVEEEPEIVVHGRFTKAKCWQMGKAMHADFHRTGCTLDIFVGSTFVSLYAKCGCIADARSVFDSLLERDVVVWNAMLTAYIDQGLPEMALQLHRQMQQEGLSPDETTLACIIQASGKTGSLVSLRVIHTNLVSWTSHLSPLLASALITAYGRCSSMVDARILFDSLPWADAVPWNALIAGYARQGDYEACMQCFENMKLVGVNPTGVTFLSLISACSHSGLLDKGVEHFASMSRDHGITPQIEHFVSVVDLLGRAGWFSTILDMLSVMPMQPNLTLWLCLLGACRKHGKVALARQAFDCAVRLHPKHPSAYIVMTNIYTDAGLLERAEEVIALEHVAEASDKPPGYTWIEYNHKVKTFMVQDRRDPQHEEVFALLGKFLK